MKIKNNVEIIDITHDDLVNLFSTALYGSSYLSAEYNKDFYNSIPADKKKGDCYEDHIADVLLNGGEIYIYDAYPGACLFSRIDCAFRGKRKTRQQVGGRRHSA